MLFMELMRLRKDSQSGAVPMDVLRRLKLPMPEDVLEQFINDHGLNHDFQRQYGQLDLHALEWNRVPTPASEIIACSVYPDFREHLENRRDQAAEVPKSGWKDVCIAADAKRQWQNHRTWLRTPLFIGGNLVGSNRKLHLIEGHTRTGVLTGLVQSGWLPGDSSHEIWVASAAKTPDPDTSWQAVLRAERMPFLDWLIHREPNEGSIGKVGYQLLCAKCDNGITGEDLAAVLAFIAEDKTLAPYANLVRDSHRRWEEETSR